MQAESSGSWPSRKCTESEDKAGQSENSSLLDLSPGVCWTPGRKPELGSQGTHRCVRGEHRCVWPGGGVGGLSGTCFWSAVVHAPVLIRIAQNRSSSTAGSPVPGPALCVIGLKIDTPLGLEWMQLSQEPTRTRSSGGHRGAPWLPPGRRDPWELAPPSRVGASARLGARSSLLLPSVFSEVKNV